MIKDRSEVEKLMIKQMLSEMDQGRHLLGDLSMIESQVDLKNLCCKVTPEFEQEVKNIADVLNIPKTRFIEAALISAMESFKEIAKETGFGEFLVNNSKESK